MTASVAYQGVPGAFGEEAAIAFARDQARLVPCPLFSAVFDAVARGDAERGTVPIENTLAGAVQDVLARAEGDAAAIASRRAADRYGGVVLRDGVEDHPSNFTRFLSIARRSPGMDVDAELEVEKAARKTSLVVTLEHRPGTLARLLSTFAARGIDLSKIESRPMRGKPFEYLFYVDVVGDARHEPLASALSAIEQDAASLRVLGTYLECAKP